MKKLALTCVCFITSLSHADNQSKPPELWSWFKDLDKSSKACEIQSSFVLNKLKIENQTENQYGIYGNIKDNRIVVKCIAIGKKASYG